MNCRQVQSRLDAFLDQELDGHSMLKIRRHLAECACCEQEYRELQGLKSMLSTLRSPELSEARVDYLVQNVMASQTAKAKTQDRTWRVAVFAAVASGFLAFGLLEFRKESPQRPSTPSMASGIERDQASMALTDPFGGRAPVVMTSNGR